MVINLRYNESCIEESWNLLQSKDAQSVILALAAKLANMVSDRRRRDEAESNLQCSGLITIAS